MVTSINQNYVLGLFNTSNTDNNGIISVDLSSLLASSSGSSSSSSTAVLPAAPRPPWAAIETPITASSNVQNALAGLPIINSSGSPVAPGQGVSPGDAEDYSKLFQLYQGLSTLNDIVTQAASKSLSPQQQAQLSKAFSSGLTQVSQYVSATSFKNLRLAFGADASTASAKLTTAKPATTYVTPTLATSGVTDVPAFDGDVQFNVAVTLNKKTTNVPIDLSGMGAQTRSVGNVVTYINDQLKAAGVQTRVAVSRTPGQPQTITAGGSTITLPATSDSFAMQVNIGTSETVSFSPVATATAGAVYVAQTGGNPNPDNNIATDDSDQRAQLQKFQTDTTNLAAPPQTTGQANFTPGRVFSNNIDPNIGTVHAEQVGPDGSVYMLADVTGSVEGQSLNGAQDVALVKYDSAGHLIYTRTLGASSTATGLGLAVSSTGQVAVTGAVTGALSGATNGALNSSAGSGDSDSFVTLYDSSGNELWTERRGSSGNDQANQASFSADGKTLYVAGNAQGTMPGGAPIGGQDGYIEAFQTTAAGNPKVLFTQSFGTTGQDATKGMVVDGNSLITASVENGDAVLRNFDISSGTPVLTNTRDLGSLQGGTIVGLGLNGGQVVVAGTTTNAALSAGTVTAASTGGNNAFAAQVDASLTPQASDAIAYYGTPGTQATTMAVSGGQVWIGGTATSALPGQTFVGTKDGFIAQLNVSTGQVVSSNEFTGKDGMASPTAIAVNTTGSSALDRLGLPTGVLGGDTSQQLTAQSSLRAGEQFTVSAGAGPPTTITIKSNDTLATIATEIQRASGSEATATIVNLGNSSKLTVTPAYASAVVTLGAGPTGNNALATLGLPEGVLNQTVTANDITSPADGRADIYGLGLSSTLNLSTPAQISLAKASIGAAMGEVRQAYQAIVAAETPTNPAQKAAAAAAQNGKSGTVPTYLTNEIANLNAGLARLTGGSTSTTSTLI